MFNRGELNYSIGVLVVLVLIFWVTCKCIGEKSESDMCIRQPVRRHVNDKRINHYTLNVPSSKTSLRYLNDVYMNDNLENGSGIDDKQVSMHLKKQTETMISDVPLSNTSNYNKILRSEVGY